MCRPFLFPGRSRAQKTIRECGRSVLSHKCSVSLVPKDERFVILCVSCAGPGDRARKRKRAVVTQREVDVLIVVGIEDRHDLLSFGTRKGDGLGSRGCAIPFPRTLARATGLAPRVPRRNQTSMRIFCSPDERSGRARSEEGIHTRKHRKEGEDDECHL